MCSNMNGSRDYHTKWCKSERYSQILYAINYMWNLDVYNTYELIYETETRHRHRKQTYDYQMGKEVGRDNLGVLD